MHVSNSLGSKSHTLIQPTMAQFPSRWATDLGKESNLVHQREEVKSMFSGALEELKIDFHGQLPD
jgi:hypothetical protein